MVTKVMFVCSGNICRSPLAHRLFEHILQEAGRSAEFEVASSGTGTWHIGQNADSRMREVAQKHGWTLTKYAQRFVKSDLDTYNHILVMDKGHLADIQHITQKSPLPQNVALFRSYDPEASDQDMEVPDPYAGGMDGFEYVYTLIERTCRHIVSRW